MDSKFTVFYVDVLSLEVRKIVEDNLPEQLRLVSLDSPERGEIIAKANEADFLGAGTSHISGEMIAAGKSIRLIQKFGIGIDRIDLETAKKLDIPVAITAGENAVAVAEHTIMLILAVLRRLSYVHRSLLEGEWLKGKVRLFTHELFGKTVGLIGTGHIGREVGRRLKPFETKLVYYDIVKLSKDLERELYASYLPLEELLAVSDVVSLHVPLSIETENMIGKQELGLMKKDAILVNTARGQVVDEAALYEALANNRIGGAGLDVFAKEPPEASYPLLHLDNVVVSPHSAGLTLETYSRVLRHAFDNMLKISRGEPLPEEDIIYSGKTKVAAG